MASGITKIVDKMYSEECLDIFHIKSICKLYNTKSNSNSKSKSKSKSNISSSISLSDFDFSSPDFKRISPHRDKKKHLEVLKSIEFTKKYAFFIRIMYACLKIDIDIFDVNDDIITLKNNYQLIRALEFKKKQLILENIGILKNKFKNISQPLNEYEVYVRDFISKIKIIDKIAASIGKLIKFGVFEKTDSLLTLILPYFYTYTDFIEEYD